MKWREKVVIGVGVFFAIIFVASLVTAGGQLLAIHQGQSEYSNNPILIGSAIALGISFLMIGFSDWLRRKIRKKEQEPKELTEYERELVQELLGKRAMEETIKKELE